MAEWIESEGGALAPRLPATPAVTRRDLLKLLGGAAGIAALPRSAWTLVRTAGDGRTLATLDAMPFAVPAETFRVTARRRDDGLLLTFIFYNLVVTGTTTRVLTRQHTAQKAFVGIQFEGQHLLEQAVAEGTTPGAPPLGALLAGTSRLVFQVPSTTTQIPYTLANLLDWSGFVPNLAARRAPEGRRCADARPTHADRDVDRSALGPVHVARPERSLAERDRARDLQRPHRALAHAPR